MKRQEYILLNAKVLFYIIAVATGLCFLGFLGRCVTNRYKK